MPESATVEDVAKLYPDSWKLGVKALAIYRDNCKVAQPLAGKQAELVARSRDAARDADRAPGDRPQVPGRRVRGLHPRRPVPRRHAGRRLRRHRQGGHDPRRPDERADDLRVARASSTACRSTSTSRSSATCASSRRASRTTPTSASRSRSSTTSSAGSARSSSTPTSRPSSASCPPRCGRGCRASRPRPTRSATAPRSTTRWRPPSRSAPSRRSPVGPARALQRLGGRAGVREVRRPQGAHRLVLHLPRLRRQLGLRVG